MPRCMKTTTRALCADSPANMESSLSDENFPFHHNVSLASRKKNLPNYECVASIIIISKIKCVSNKVDYLPECDIGHITKIIL